MKPKKQMFSGNQVSIRDLFSSHTRGGYKTEPCDQAVESNSQSLSQLPFSQVENEMTSQYSSQSSDSLGKKFYGLYNHKSSLFSRDSQTKASNLNPQPAKVSYHQQMQNNKAKAKERDERDLLENVVTFMRECSAEIKMAVSIVKETVHTGATTSQDSLAMHLEKLQDDLSKHKQEMIEALRVRDDMKTKVSKLEQTIVSKDAKIEELEKTIEEYKKQENREIIQQLQRTFREESQVTQDHITQSYQAHKQGLDDIAQDQSKSKQEILQQTKHLQRNMMDQNFGVLKEVQNKMHEDLEHQQKSETRARQRLREEIQRELSITQTQQREEVKALLRQQLQQIDSITDQRQHDVFRQQQKQLEELQTKHRDDLSKSLQQQLSCMSKEQKKFAEALIQDVWDKERQGAHNVLREQQKSLKDEMQQSFEKELQGLKERHEKEVHDILSKQLEDSRKNEESLAASNRERYSENRFTMDSQDGLSLSLPADNNNNYDVIDKSRGYFPKKKNDAALENKSSLQVTSMFRSPLLTNSKNWMSKNLFSKRNSSPVARVQPLVQEAEVCTYQSSVKPCTRSSQLTTTAVNLNTETRQQPKTKSTKKRRKKSIFNNRRKRPKKVTNSQSNEDTQEVNRDPKEPDYEEDEEDSSYISNRFDTVPPYKSQSSDKTLLTQRSCSSALWMKGSVKSSSQSSMNIYDFDEDCAAEPTSNTLPGDARWYAALNTNVSTQITSLPRVRMPSIMKSPDLSQVDEGCSSVGSSPAYSVVDFMNMLKNKEKLGETDTTFNAGQTRVPSTYRSDPQDLLSSPSLFYPLNQNCSNKYRNEYVNQRQTRKRLQ